MGLKQEKQKGALKRPLNIELGKCQLLYFLSRLVFINQLQHELATALKALIQKEEMGAMPTAIPTLEGMELGFVVPHKGG